MIDFSKVEGITPEALEVLNSENIQSAIETEINNNLDVAKAEFKIKMNNMDSKVKEAQAVASKFEGLDPDEISVLQEARKKNPELEAALDLVKKEKEEALSRLEQKENLLKEKEFKDIISTTVNSFNTHNPDISVRDDMRDIIDDLAIKQFKEVDGALVPHKIDGTPIITKDGYGKASDWIEQLRADRPSLFNAPTGSGASGSNRSGATTTPKGSMAGSKDERIKAIASKFDLN